MTDIAISRKSLLWLLATQFLVIAPHVLNAPLWIWLVWAVVVFWRWQIFKEAWGYPGKAVKTFLLLVCCVGLFFSFGGKLGTSGMVSLLLTGFTLKLIELRKRRDCLLVCYLGYLVIATQFLFYNSIAAAFYGILCIFVLTHTLLTFSQSRFDKGFYCGLRSTGAIMLQALPIMLLLFLVMPRFGPFWSVPLDTSTARTGEEQTDSSVEIFIKSLEVRTETLDIHLAMANLMRRKGEIIKAIAIHENLLSHSALAVPQTHQVQLELARDYVHAGLLDRAESLLEGLVKIRSRYTTDAREQLLHIYQNEKEWQKAIDVATRLEEGEGQLGSQELALMKSHYCCELAEVAITARHLPVAEAQLQLAFRYQQHSVRASLLTAQLAYEQGEHRTALKYLIKIPEQDGDLVGESLPLLVACFTALGDREGLRQFLFSTLNRHRANSLIVALASIIFEREGEEAAVAFLELQLAQRPSIRVLKQLIDVYLVHSEGKSKQNLELLKGVVEKVIAEKPAYLCGRCGFTAIKLHWLCPGCKSWGSIKPVKGVSGE